MVKCTSNEFSKSAKVYMEPNVIDNFFKCLFEEVQQICDILSKFKPLNLSMEEEKSFQKSYYMSFMQKRIGYRQSERSHASASIHI